MNTERLLLSAIAADPADHEVRLALADWLEEAGRAAQADLARLHARQLMKVGTPAELERLCALLERGVQPVAPEVVNSIGMRFVPIPPGTFLMGSPEEEEERSDHEGPQHEVEISRPFWMGVFPVTLGQFRAFVEAARYETEAGRCNWTSPGFDQTDDCPVTCVCWDDAVAFVEWLSGLEAERRTGRWYRLPSEAEWEYSCRGGAASYQVFHVGDSLNSTRANFDGNYPYGAAAEGDYRERTTPLDAFAPNGFGLQDLHGNVWEWCADWSGKDYYKDSPRVDPLGPPQGLARVIRGGGWNDYAGLCRSAYRGGLTPAFRIYYLGFRVALVPSGRQ